LRLWLVSHELVTSGSPTEEFEICVSGAYFRGIWFPECGGPCDGPSQFPFLKGTPSRRPRARGAGPPECGGRARTASRPAPQCGAQVLPRSSPAMAAPDRGGAPAGARGYAPSPYGGPGSGRQGCCRVSGAGPLTVLGGPTGGRVPSMASPPPPHLGGCRVGPPPPSGESSRGSGPRGGAEGARGKGPCPRTGAHKKGVGGGQTGTPSTTDRHRPPLHRFSS